MTSKTVFQNEKELCRWWNMISHDERFARVLLFIRSEFMDTSMTPDSLRGAKEYQNLLLTIGESEDKAMQLPGAGLNHDLESDLRNPTPVHITEAPKE